MSLVSQGGQGGYSPDPEIGRLYEQNNIRNIADNTAEIAWNQQARLSEQRRTNDLLQVNTALAFQANATLDEIAGSLNNMGYVLKDLAATAKRTEGLQLQQVDVQRQQLRVSQQQLALQQKHFGSVERERIVKEVLYQMEKMLTFIDGLSDSQAKAYWAMRQLQEIAWRGFTTKDVSDINDKRLFDQLTSRAKAVVNGLTETQRTAAETYLKQTTDYLRLQSTSDDANVPPPAKYLKANGEPVAPVAPPQVGTGEWTIARIKALENCVDNAEKEAGFRPFYIGFSFVAGLVATALTGVVFQNIVCLIVGVVVFVLFILKTPPPISAFVRDVKSRFGIKVAPNAAPIPYVGSQLLELQRYRRKLESGQVEQAQKIANARQDVEAHNAKAEQHNRKREQAIAVHGKRRRATMETLLGSINAFTKQHPDVFRPA